MAGMMADPAGRSRRRTLSIIIQVCWQKWDRSSRIGCGSSWYPAWSIAEVGRSEEHTSELQSPCNLVSRLLLEQKNAALPLPRARDTGADRERDRTTMTASSVRKCHD